MRCIDRGMHWILFFVSGKPLQYPECPPGQSELGASRRDRDLCTSISLYRNCVLAVQNCRSKRAFYSGLHRSIQEWVSVLVTAIRELMVGTYDVASIALVGICCAVLVAVFAPISMSLYNRKS